MSRSFPSEGSKGEPSLSHSWNVSVKKARQIQDTLRSQVIIEPLPENIRLVAGADVSFNIGSNTVYAGVVILKYPDLTIIDQVGICEKVDFPYIPGLLAFREGPPVIHAFKQTKYKPDVIIYDAHGSAHPRRLGLACHLGLLLDIPSIGCAKTRLTGTYEEPGKSRGATAHLVDGDNIIGSVLRTRNGVKPMFISVGHRVDLETSVQFILDCSPKYRQPEPTRQAHLLVNKLRRGELSSRV